VVPRRRRSKGRPKQGDGRATSLLRIEANRDDDEEAAVPRIDPAKEDDEVIQWTEGKAGVTSVGGEG